MRGDRQVAARLPAAGRSVNGMGCILDLAAVDWSTVVVSGLAAGIGSGAAITGALLIERRRRAREVADHYADLRAELHAGPVGDALQVIDMCSAGKRSAGWELQIRARLEEVRRLAVRLPATERGHLYEAFRLRRSIDATLDEWTDRKTAAGQAEGTATERDEARTALSAEYNGRLRATAAELLAALEAFDRDLQEGAVRR